VLLRKKFPPGVEGGCIEIFFHPFIEEVFALKFFSLREVICYGRVVFCISKCIYLLEGCFDIKKISPPGKGFPILATFLAWNSFSGGGGGGLLWGVRGRGVATKNLVQVFSMQKKFGGNVSIKSHTSLAGGVLHTHLLIQLNQQRTHPAKHVPHCLEGTISAKNEYFQISFMYWIHTDEEWI